jgi:hypothetical protein
MKTLRLWYVPALAAFFIAALATVSCASPASGDPEPIPEGEGVLQVILPGSGASGAVRSVLPDSLLHSLKYTLTFKKGAEEISVPDRTGGIYTITLAAGDWTVEVEAYDPSNNHVGTGSTTVTVTAGQRTQALIVMDPVGTYAENIYVHSGAELRYYVAAYDDVDVTFHLVDDISVTGFPVMELLGFLGTLDGHGHTIALSISDVENWQSGLFAKNYGVIKNLKLTGSVTGTFNSSLNSANIGAGAVVADNQGTIKNVVSTVTVSATQNGTGNLYAGGIAGINSGTIEDCSAGGDVLSTKPGTGNAPHGGGIAGRNEGGGAINRCYAYGIIRSAGANIGNVGGIVGWNSGTISNCAALNSKVDNTNTIINFQGRVAGYIDNSGALVNNHAYADMQVGDPSVTFTTNKTATQLHGADIAGATLSTDSVTALWTATALNWPAFQASPAIEPTDDSTSPWYWSKTISIPANTVNTTGVSPVYVPALWFE